MLRIYFMLKAQYLKTAMEYKLNFWMMAFAGVLMRTLMMGVAYVLYRNVHEIAGFSEGEVYLIMAFMFITEGISNIFFDGIWHIPRLVFSGELDVILARPVSPLYQILAHDIGLQGVGVLAMGFTTLFMALQSLGLLTLPMVIVCLLFIVTGSFVRCSTYLIGASALLYFKSTGNLNTTFEMYTIGENARYPVNVYPIWLQAILYTVIPYAFIGYIPMRILRGEMALMLSALLLIVTALYALLARQVFYRGLAKYESMGM